MEIIIVDHTEKRIYSNMHEAIGKGQKLLDLLAAMNYNEFYRLTPYDKIPIRTQGTEWQSQKFDDVYILEIF